MCAEAELGRSPTKGAWYVKRRVGAGEGPPSRQPQAFGEIVQLLQGNLGAGLCFFVS